MFKIITTVLFTALFSLSAFAAQLIDRDSAANTALKKAEGKVTKLELEEEGGMLVYEIKILDLQGFSHQIDINALTGDMVGYKADKMPTDLAVTLNGAKLSYREAEKIATDNQKNTRAIDTDLWSGKSHPTYRIKLLDKDGIKYSAEIDAVDGAVLLLRQDGAFRVTPSVSAADAEKAALKTINGEIIYTVLDNDGGKLLYEIDMLSKDGRLYEVKVDAVTGAVLKAKIND